MKLRRKLCRMGATGKYPDGSLGPHDEGEIQFGVAADTTKGLVHINFGKDVSWLAMPPEVAIEFGEKLIENAKKVKEGT